MNSKRPQPRMPRVSKGAARYPRYHWPRHRRHWPYCPDWYDRDYEYDYDYDYDYDWHDYPYDNYIDARRSKSSQVSKAWGEESEAYMAYQQGFKDGWMAAMEYVMYSECVTPPEPAPEPTPPAGTNPENHSA